MSIPFIPPRAYNFPRFLTSDFFMAALIALVATGLTFLGLLLFAPAGTYTFSWLEITAVALNYGATYLSIKRRRFFYLIGIVASAMYAVVYGQVGLLASAVLSMYLTLSLVYGWLRWGKDTKSRPIHHISLKWVPAYIAATLVFWFGAFLIVRALGGELPFWDAWILVLTILAQFMLDNKVIETWFVWVAVNIFGFFVYANYELWFATVQQVLFGLANVWGYLAWRKAMRAENLSDNDMRVKPVNNPLDYRADGSIRPGDPAYDFMMGVMDSGKPAIMNQQEDGTWKEQDWEPTAYSPNADGTWTESK